MDTHNSTINCPECGEKIIINTLQLLQGAKFTCLNCKTIIGLSSEGRSELGNILHNNPGFNKR